MKFSIKDSFSKCDQIRWKLRIFSYLLQKSLMENFFFCAAFVKPSMSIFQDMLSYLILFLFLMMY